MSLHKVDVSTASTVALIHLVGCEEQTQTQQVLSVFLCMNSYDNLYQPAAQ